VTTPSSSAISLASARSSRRSDLDDRLRIGDSLRSCLTVWLVTRILTVGAGSGIALLIGKSFAYPWQQWDAGWFLHIAHHGYSSDQPLYREAPAFYPLYPALLWFGGAVLGGHDVLAGILLAFPLTLAAFVLLYILARELVHESVAAQRAVAYLAVFPYAFFLQALYSEVTFLVCAIAAFVAAERKRFLLAGVLTGAAMLTRYAGIAVLAGIVVLALISPGRRAALVRLCVAPIIFCAFPLVLFLEGRSPLAFLNVEHGWRDYSVYDPRGTVLAPFYSVLDGAQAAWTGAGKLVSGSPLTPFTIHNVTAFAVLVVFVLLSAAAWKRLGTAYGVYCAVSLAIPLVARGAEETPLLSLQRFALVLFPCFIVLGTLPVRRYAYGAVVVLSCAGLIGLLYLWTGGHGFVA
jgi:Gpi18-like mannosyltransferase